MDSEKIKILAIDDNLDNLITIQALVSEMFVNATVIFALNGKEGLQLAEQEDLDVILLDVVMPGMDGFEVCEKLKANNLLCDIPVVFITALKGDKESRIRALEVGAEAFLAKPIDESELQAQIRAMLKIRRANLEKKSVTLRLEELVAEKTLEVQGINTATLNLLEDIKAEIEARKQTESELIASEALYRAILDASPDNIVITDLTGKIEMISTSTIHHFGLNQVNDIVGKSVFDFFLPSDKEKAYSDLVFAGQGIKTGPNKYKTLTADGRVLDIEVNGGVIKDENGRILKLVFIGRDITERNFAQNALKVSEIKYRELMDNSPEGLTIYVEGKEAYINKEATRLMRANSSDELIGKSIVDFIHKDNLELVTERMKLVAMAPVNVPLPMVEEKYIRLDGTDVDVEIKPMVIIYEGKPAVQLAGRDITERKKTQEALMESENRYDTFINNNVDMVFVKDEQFRYLILNDAMAKFFNKPKSDIYNKTDEELADENIFLPCISSDQRALVATEAFTIEEQLGDRIFEATKFPMKLKGDKRGIGCIMRDITLRRKSEIALEESQNELQAIYNNTPVMMALVDDKRQVKFSNKAFKNLIKTTESKLSNSSVGNIIGCVNSMNDPRGCGYGENCKNCTLRLAIEKTYKTGEEQNNIEYVLNTCANSTTEVVSASLLGSTSLIQHGNQKSLLVSLYDITDRKNAEKALQKSESLLRSFIDNSPFEIWARDTKSIGILENKKFTENFGSIIGVTPFKDKRIDNGTLNRWLNVNKKVFDGKTVDEEFEMKINNEIRQFQQIVFPILLKEKTIGIAGFNIDITEKKKTELSLQESREQLTKFVSHLQNVREEERTLLAREIHDDLGQILVAMKIDMGMMKKSMEKLLKVNDPTKILEKFQDLILLADSTIKTTRRIMTNLRPEVLDMLGFIEAVRQYLRNFEERHNIECELVNNTAELELTPQHSVALYRIIQEALTNIAKHAKASYVHVQIEKSENNLLVAIIDDGVGFDQTAKLRTDSYGMIGMKERVFLLGAKLTITGELGKGTTVKVEMPL